MKKLLSTTAIIAAFTVTGANADDHNEGGYIETSVGLVNMWDNNIGGGPVDYENGYNLNVSFGYDWDYGDSIRPEIELSYRSNDVDGPSNNELDQYSAMANFFYDFENDSRYTPYAGVGVGATYADVDGTLSDDDTVFAYQGMLGASYEIDEAMDVTLEYKYHNAMDVEIATGEEDIESNNVEIGLRFKY